MEHTAIRWPTSWMARLTRDRKSTRLNSSHRCISYAVFCLKKKTFTGAEATLSSGATTPGRFAGAAAPSRRHQEGINTGARGFRLDGQEGQLYSRPDAKRFQ